jgi:hypothetical protein
VKNLFVIILVVLSALISGCSFFCYLQNKKHGVGENSDRENIKVFSFRIDDFPLGDVIKDEAVDVINKLNEDFLDFEEK